MPSTREEEKGYLSVVVTFIVRFCRVDETVTPSLAMDILKIGFFSPSEGCGCRECHTQVEEEKGYSAVTSSFDSVELTKL